MSSFFQRIFPFILGFLLCCTAYGCASTQYPSDSVLKDALSLQLNLAERSLDNLFETDEGLTDVVSVRPSSMSLFENEEGELVSISGRCDCRFLGTKEKNDSSFQLFLERGAKGESWRLARPQISSDGDFKYWSTYPLLINP